MFTLAATGPATLVFEISKARRFVDTYRQQAGVGIRVIIAIVLRLSPTVHPLRTMAKTQVHTPQQASRGWDRKHERNLSVPTIGSDD